MTETTLKHEKSNYRSEFITSQIEQIDRLNLSGDSDCFGPLETKLCETSQSIQKQLLKSATDITDQEFEKIQKNFSLLIKSTTKPEWIYSVLSKKYSIKIVFFKYEEKNISSQVFGSDFNRSIGILEHAKSFHKIELEKDNSDDPLLLICFALSGFAVLMALFLPLFLSLINPDYLRRF